MKGLRRQLFQQKLPYPKFQLSRYSISFEYKKPTRIRYSLFRKPIFQTTVDNQSIWAVPFPGSDKSVVQRTQYFNYTQLNKKPVSIEKEKEIRHGELFRYLGSFSTVFSNVFIRIGS